MVCGLPSVPLPTGELELYLFSFVLISLPLSLSPTNSIYLSFIKKLCISLSYLFITYYYYFGKGKGLQMVFRFWLLYARMVLFVSFSFCLVLLGDCLMTRFLMLYMHVIHDGCVLGSDLCVIWLMWCGCM